MSAASSTRGAATVDRSARPVFRGGGGDTESSPDHPARAPSGARVAFQGGSPPRVTHITNRVGRPQTTGPPGDFPHSSGETRVASSRSDEPRGSAELVQRTGNSSQVAPDGKRTPQSHARHGPPGKVQEGAPQPARTSTIQAGASAPVNVAELLGATVSVSEVMRPLRSPVRIVTSWGVLESFSKTTRKRGRGEGEGAQPNAPRRTRATKARARRAVGWGS